MDDTVKAVEQRCMESSTPILKTSGVVPMNQCETRETEVSTEDAKDKAMAKDGVQGKVGSQSGQKTIRPEFQPERKSNQVGTDSVESRSVEADPDRSQSSRKPIRRDRSGKKLRRTRRRSKWLSLRHLICKQSSLLNTRKVVGVCIQMSSCNGKRKMRNEKGSKFLDQGDGWDEGGTCVVHEGIYSREVTEPTASDRSERYEGRI